jgi:hypothetical protein
MIALLLSLALASPPDNASSALELCKPVLARKAEGDISTISVTSSRSTSAGLTIRGRLTASFGMGPAPAGSARTHHLGRADLSFSCRIRHGRVREATLDTIKL